MTKSEFYAATNVSTRSCVQTSDFVVTVMTPHETVTLELGQSLHEMDRDSAMGAATKAVNEAVEKSWEDYRGQLAYD